jgi:hypothetical protein
MGYNQGMLRLGLTVWFVLTTLIGPSLCCCTNFSLAGTSKHPAVATIRNSVASHCPYCRGERPSRQDDSAPSKVPNCPACPFRDGPDRPSVTSGTAPTLADRIADLRSWVDQTVGGVLTLAPLGMSFSLVQIDRDHLAPPFPTADDILHVHHVLRC